MVSRAYAHTSHRTVTNGERFLNQLPPQGRARGNRPRSSVFPGRGLFAYHHSCSPRGRLLIKHTSKGCLSTFPEDSEGEQYFCALPLLCSRASASLEGELFSMSGIPVFTSSALVFMVAAQGIPRDQLALLARGPCIPGSHWMVTKRGSSWLAITPRVLHRTVD